MALVGFLALVFSSAGVQAQDFEGLNVTAVDFRFQGEQTVDEARLRSYVQLQAGSPYRTDKVDNDIKALYESGFVDDVRVLAEPMGDGVRVVYEVSTRQDIVAIGFVGNYIVKDNKLAKETKLKAGGPMSDANIIQARQNLEEYYRKTGYPDVLITHRYQESDTGRGVDLIFVIDEGGKNEVRKIRFEGNNTFDTKTLRAQMETKQKDWLSWITGSGKFEDAQLELDVQSVLDFYRSKGYLRASSPGARREPVKDGKVDLVIPINEGEKYTVNGVGFGRMTVFTEEELYPALTLDGGDAYSSVKMRRDITTIRSFYGSRGYADCNVTADIRDAGPNQVNIIYRITEGSRFRVGNVNIEGNTKTKDQVIRREVPLKPEDYYNSVEEETTKLRLEGTTYFSAVEVSSSPSSRGGNYRDVDILVQEGQTGSISAGIGFSSIDSIVGFVNLEQRNFDIRNPWGFTGGGQRFAMDLRLGSERADFGISLVEPFFLGRKLEAGVELFYRDSQYYSDFYEQTNVGGATWLRKAVGEKSYIRGEYRLENVEVDLDPAVAVLSANSVANGGPPSLLLFDGGDYVRSALSGSYVYDSRDSAIETRTGHKIDATVTVAGTFLGGDVDHYGLSLRGQKFWNMRWDSIFSINSELAFVDATSGSVPIFDRMYLGGGRTLRGYEFRDVGPRDPVTGEVVGGQSLGFMSFEYTVPVIDTIRVAAFYDLGFVNADAWDLSPSDLYHDVGFGVRVRLPISPVPIALDYAIPLSPPDPLADNGGQFNFYLNYQY